MTIDHQKYYEHILKKVLIPESFKYTQYSSCTKSKASKLMQVLKGGGLQSEHVQQCSSGPSFPAK